MRAARYDRHGPAREVLRVVDIAAPEPGPGEVRIKLVTSGVNPSDVKARNGLRPVIPPFVVPHSDGAGVIDKVGAGVPATRIGERVWTWNAQWKRPFGTAAEYVVLPQALAVRLPDTVSFEAGACLGIPAMTAWHAVAVAELDPKAHVLIAGGAGGVAHYAIQFAKARGATVLTTISSPAKAKLARQAGADHTIDYKSEDVAARVKDITGGKGVDAVLELDLAANARLIPGVLKPKGLVVVYGTGAPEAQLPAGFCLVNAITLRFIFVYELNEQERADAIAGIMGMLEAGRLIHNIAAAFPLDDIAAAHEAVEQGSAAGNVVVTIAQPPRP